LEKEKYTTKPSLSLRPKKYTTKNKFEFAAYNENIVKKLAVTDVILYTEKLLF
jgi:hypothetical protein